jgi:hypothetical protein
MRSYLSGRAGCLYRQAAGSWNVLDTLGDVIICNHLSATRRFRTSNSFYIFPPRLGTGLLTVMTDCTGRLFSSKCYSVWPNFLEEAHVSNLVVFIGMGVMELCHIV